MFKYVWGVINLRALPELAFLPSPTSGKHTCQKFICSSLLSTVLLSTPSFYPLACSLLCTLNSVSPKPKKMEHFLEASHARHTVGMSCSLN